MASIISQNFDTTPPADETTATNAAHTSGGAGTGFDTIIIGTGGAVKWDSDTPHTGTRCLRVDVGNPAAFTIFRPFDTGSAIPSVWVRAYVKFPSLPAANTIFTSINNTTAAIASLQYTTTGQIRLRSGSATTVAT
jgi:hypothetical protein